jgi:VanZ family protein
MAPAYWLPPVVWMAIIFGLSSDTASAEQTSRFLLPLLRWLLPWATSGQLDLLHAAARKSGHLVEYAVLAALWFRAFAPGRGLTPRRASWLALAIAVVWAFVDEGHQSMLLSRTGSALDVGIDAGGAVLALGVAHRGWRAALDGAIAALLWLACLGGGAALAVNVWAGVPSGVLWATAPAAALLLVVRRRRARRGA